MDLTCGWDCTRMSDRLAAIRHLETAKPLLLIGSPPCTEYTLLRQNWSTRRMPTGDALDSRCSARATGLRRAEASAAAALLGPGMPPPCRPGEAPAPLCRPGDAALRGSCEPGSIEPAGSEAARPPMLLSAIPLMPCRSSKGDEVSERIVAAPSGPLEGLNLPLSLRSGSGPAFASIVRFSAGPRRRDGGLTRSPSWRRGFVGWGGGAPEPLLLLLVLSSS